MSITIRLAIVLCIIFATVDVWAAQPVGRTALVSGTVTLLRGGKNFRLAQGTALYNGDTITTPKDAVAKILLIDDSLVTVGSRSKFVIENFATGKQGRFGSFRLYFGKMRAIVSKLAEGKSDIRFSTPTAVAGVRGTHLVVQYDANTQQTIVSVLEGSVAFRSLDQASGAEILVGARQQSSQSGTSSASAPGPISQADMQALDIEIKEQTPGTQDDESREPGQPRGTGTDSAPEESGANEGADGNLEQNLNRVGETTQQGSNPLEEHNPAVNPAADTGVRVRW